MKFHDSYKTNTPTIFAAVVAFTFVLVALVFFIYDLLVQHRNEKIVVTAARSNAYSFIHISRRNSRSFAATK